MEEVEHVVLEEAVVVAVVLPAVEEEVATMTVQLKVNILGECMSDTVAPDASEYASFL